MCILVDLFNREIIGYSAGIHKDAHNRSAKHSDVPLRSGSEFKNQLLDEVISTFEIKRSLSMKGCPYDNAVVEATFKIFETEFVYGRNFDSLCHELTQYIE